MADVNTIITADRYTGDSNLGGGSMGVAHIDTRPIEQLTAYSVEYQKAEWNQSAQDTQNAIGQLAEIAKYDPNNAIPKDKPEALKAYQDLQTAGEEFSRKLPKNNNERMQFFLDFQQKTDQAKKLIKSANGRSIAYQTRKNAILGDSSLEPAQKEILINQLDGEANSTDVFTPLSAQEKFNLALPKMGAAQVIKTDVQFQGPNGVTTASYEIFDPERTNALAYSEVNGLAHVMIDPSSPEYQNLTPAEKERNALISKGNNDIRVWQTAETAYNSALADPTLKDVNGNLDINRVKSTNPIIANTVALIDRYNQYAKKMQYAARNGGEFTDATGRPVKLLQQINESSYFLIDKTKPLTAAQLNFLDKFAKASPDTKSVKYQQTDDAIQRQNIEAENERERMRIKAQKDIAAMKQTPTAATQDFGNVLDDVNAGELQGIKTKDGRHLTTDSKGRPFRISNGVVLDGDGNPVDTGEFEVVLQASTLGESIVSEYNKAQAGKDGERESQIDVKNGHVRAIFKDGQIQGIKTNKGTIADRNYFADITQKAAVRGVTKQKPATQLGEGLTPDGRPVKVKAETPEERAARILAEQ